MSVASWDDIGGLVGAYERFQAGARVESDVRDSILDSWKRCRSAGLESDRLLIPYAEGLGLEDRFLTAANPVFERLTSALTDVKVTVVLADAKARVIQRGGADPGLNARLDSVQFAPGFGFAEQIAGTNGIGTALAERRACLVLGREHFADCMQPFACAGAPVRDPFSGRIEGILDLTCLRGDADPAMLNLVREAVADIEQRLLEQATQRERALLAAYRRANSAHLSAGRPPRTGADDAGAARGIDRIDRAVLRDKAEELIASPHRTLDEVTLSGGRVATLLRRPVMSATGEAGVVVEARILGGPRLRHLAQTVADTQVIQATRAIEAAQAVQAAQAIQAGLPGLAATPADSAKVSLAGMPTATVNGDTAEAVEAAATVNGDTAGMATTVVLPQPQPQPQALGTDETEAEAEAERGGADGWLLVGEPGVGQLAVLARRRLELLHDAGVRIGTALDVTRTAEELAEVSVPRFADFVAVDLPDSVLRGDEPESVGADTGLRRVALGAVREGPHLDGLHGVGDPVRYIPATPQARCLETGRPVLEPVLADAGGWIAQDPAGAERALAAGIHSLIAVPLRARGVTLGVVSFYRSDKPVPFEDDDLSLAQELVGRAAICIDNARLFTREHNTALALQRSLLPRGRPEQNAVDVAYRYLPAHAGVGGDWFDVIPLSGARVALVVGDVVGHGLHAAATMGRLRTAVHNFCSLDLPPDDLLTHLDDLVGRLDGGEGWEAGDGTGLDAGVIGATCLYAVYDPVSRRCTLTRAGHPQPALVRPDGTVEFLDVPSGPPLGVGGMPFETVELELPEGSQLVLFTDGLVEDRLSDIDDGLERLRGVLASAGRPPEETCEAVLDALLPARRVRPRDDIALLVARTRALGPGQVAQWELPSDPAVVARARAEVTRQLAAWDLDDLAFTTELVASELVTNAIRHATGPVQLRLLRDRALICEVSDGSSTSPRLRRARTEDEGGRGLFLVAQLTERWGTRYTSTGKIIWTEQALP
ncbi:SpoIIE family protein phosphatase [Streptomyces sp. NPDC050704]|uniref:SpoIIE family protein phosphatase n=1 Tax=Streptomyces sp. NPDC050704 TaxID=3157219 RepID=UPI00341B8938